MKTLSIALLLCSALFAATSCGGAYKPITKVKPQNNQNYEVEYLFEHEGCKVYRFKDIESYVYFTNCTGDVTTIKDDSTHLRVENRIKVSKPK